MREWGEGVWRVGAGAGPDGWGGGSSVGRGWWVEVGLRWGLGGACRAGARHLLGIDVLGFACGELSRGVLEEC